MIRLPRRELPADLQSMLDALQARISAIADYPERVVAARQAWENRDRKRFQPIRDALTEMCSGEDRCMYCEDSAADEIEHVRPKRHYPEHAFVWKNYLFACGCCNAPKSDKFAVLSARNRQFVTLTRTRGAPVTPPEPGRMMLIDPRWEDPMRFMKLDLSGTFQFYPTRRGNCLALARSAYTIEVLQLNRDELLRARKAAYGSYTARLAQYIAERDRGAEPRRLQLRADALRRLHHPTVWREMQRQRQEMPELADLFAQAPESLSW